MLNFAAFICGIGALVFAWRGLAAPSRYPMPKRFWVSAFYFEAAGICAFIGIIFYVPQAWANLLFGVLPLTAAIGLNLLSSLVTYAYFEDQHKKHLAKSNDAPQQKRT